MMMSVMMISAEGWSSPEDSRNDRCYQGGRGVHQQAPVDGCLSGDASELSQAEAVAVVVLGTRRPDSR